MPYVDKPESMILMNYISTKIGLEIILTVIESPDRYCHMITSLSGIEYTIETRPVPNKRMFLNLMTMTDQPAE